MRMAWTSAIRCLKGRPFDFTLYLAITEGGRIQTPNATKVGLMIYSIPAAGAVGKWEAWFAFHFSMAVALP
jgi:hypothetical protein